MMNRRNLTVLVLILLCASNIQAGWLNRNKAPELPVRLITNGDSCEFLGVVSFGVMNASKLHKYATKNTNRAGGDSYTLLSNANTTSYTMTVHEVTIGMFYCGNRLAGESNEG